MHCNDVFHFFVWPRLSSYILNKSRETSRIFAWLRKENCVNKNFKLKNFKFFLLYAWLRNNTRLIRFCEMMVDE